MRYSETQEFQEACGKRFGTGDELDVDRYLAHKDEVQSIEQTTDEFMKMFRENYFGEDGTKALAFAHTLFSMHRTHQQSFVKNLFNGLKKWAELSETYHDARNELSVDWAKRATELEAHFPCI